MTVGYPMDQDSNRILIREKTLELTLLTYKAADLLPKEEPLRHNIKRRVLAFLEAMYTAPPSKGIPEETFSGLNACLKVARSLSKYASIDFKGLCDSYSIVYRMATQQEGVGDKAQPVLTDRFHKHGQIREEKTPGAIVEKVEPAISTKPLSDRQKFILQFA